VEFPDSRPLLEGSCFSLEPGLYFTDFGLRTEIDVYITHEKPVISGKNRQFAILTC
jgi:Xaa-Pro aminopeptidase